MRAGFPQSDMYYVYLIQNRANKRVRYGYAEDLRRCLREFNKTGDWELIYYEAYRAEEDAKKRANQLHYLGQSRIYIRRRLVRSLLK
ncbi:MAG: hypothetical protein ABIK47_03510 [candidate division WOR-3 bacterium]